MKEKGKRENKKQRKIKNKRREKKKEKSITEKLKKRKKVKFSSPISDFTQSPRVPGA